MDGITSGLTLNVWTSDICDRDLFAEGRVIKNSRRIWILTIRRESHCHDAITRNSAACRVNEN